MFSPFPLIQLCSFFKNKKTSTKIKIKTNKRPIRQIEKKSTQTHKPMEFNMPLLNSNRCAVGSVPCMYNTALTHG